MSACADLDPLLAAAAVDLVLDEDRARLDEHVSTCPDCAARLAAIRGCLRLPEEAPPVGSWERLSGRIASDRSVGRRVALACTFCHATLERAQAVFCAACLAPHHEDCFREHARCSAPGCDEVQVVRPTTPPGVAEAPLRFVPPAQRAGRRIDLPTAAGIAVSLGLVGVGAAALIEARARRQEAERAGAARVDSERRSRDVAVQTRDVDVRVAALARELRVLLARGEFALVQGDLEGARDAAAEIVERGAASSGHGPVQSELEPPPPPGPPDAPILPELRPLVASGHALACRVFARGRGTGSGFAQATAALVSAQEVGGPTHAGARLAAADLALLAGEVQDAVKLATTALELDPRQAEALELRGRARLELGLADEALADLGAAIDLSTGALRARVLVARANAQLEMDAAGRWRDAIGPALEDAVCANEIAGGGWAARAVLAMVRARRGERDAANGCWDEALRLAERAGPRASSAAHLARGEALREEGRPAEALEAARTAVAIDAGSLDALALAAEMEGELLNHKAAQRDAVAVLLRARELDWRAAARTHQVHARLAAEGGSVQDGLEHARKATALDPRSIDGRLLLARISLDASFEEQYLDDAEATYKDVLRLRPRSLEARRGLAHIALVKHARQPERARPRLEEAYEEDRHDPWTLRALARLELDQQRSERAGPFRQAATRAEVDVRRPEGRAFALGLRDELSARDLSGPARSALLERARDAYRRAVFLDPLHAQALARLAALSIDQGASDRAARLLQATLGADPLSTHALVLRARHRASPDALRGQAPAAVVTAAIEAVQQAIAARGETPELLALQALLTPREPFAGPPTTVVDQVTLAAERFDALIARDAVSPFALELLRRERAMFAALGAGAPAGRERMQLLDRLAELEALLEMQEKRLSIELDRRSREADGLLRQARETRERPGSDPQAVLALATQATRAAPWSVDAWHALAQARTRTRDPWGALAAGLRAAHLDDRLAIALYDLLGAASSAPVEAGADAQGDRLLALDPEAPVRDDDLRALLRAAPRVARALAARVDADEGKRVLDSLEAVIAADPTRLAPHVLAGALCAGARQDDLALRSLLLVGTVREDAAEPWYLAACVAAQQTRPDVELAAEWLARAAGRAPGIHERARLDPRLAALRAAPASEGR